MERTEILLFRKDGQRMRINLNSLIVHLCNTFSDFVKIRYENNVLYFCTEGFELSYPERGNRFSISTENRLALTLIKIITSIYENQDLIVSTPGYEQFVEAPYSEGKMKKLFGL